ncbi:prolipoprotein diacylglyceryl transferase [Paenibacillus donghaensis]|uniref:prolipoprotein diacylglyceryl transferase n=1 Tax=Paenibacillus donghaensis TaxID=414771 RepID=UPI0018837EC8|nr:prolipoprotein diacylglyceryl transferase [Paenibacillus donghaensis]MBE9914920.1 prolipoprotein diacylglyceryl transferase [Paenibacillus donghaensis]
MKNDLLHIGPITIYGYGLMIAIGIIAAYQVLITRAEKRHLERCHMSSITLWALLGGFLSAKLLYWITQGKNMMDHPEILWNLSTGFVVYGGIVGGILSGYIYCKMKGLNFLQHLDLFVPSIALAQGFGRIGCLLAGCCYGEETHGWFGITFHDSELAPNGVKLIPTQILESVFSFALFFVLIVLAKRKKPDGFIASLYLLIYSLGRFIIEFYRGDIIRGSVGILSTSQFISLLVFVATCLIMLVKSYQTLRHRNA